MCYAAETSAIQFLFSSTLKWFTFLSTFFRTTKKKTWTIAFGFDEAKVQIIIFRQKTMDYSPWFDFWSPKKVGLRSCKWWGVYSCAPCTGSQGAEPSNSPLNYRTGACVQPIHESRVRFAAVNDRSTVVMYVCALHICSVASVQEHAKTSDGVATMKSLRAEKDSFKPKI